MKDWGHVRFDADTHASGYPGPYAGTFPLRGRHARVQGVRRRRGRHHRMSAPVGSQMFTILALITSAFKALGPTFVFNLRFGAIA